MGLGQPHCLLLHVRAVQGHSLHPPYRLLLLEAALCGEAKEESLSQKSVLWLGLCLCLDHLGGKVHCPVSVWGGRAGEAIRTATH